MTGLFQLRLDRRAVTSIEYGLIAGMLVATLTLALPVFFAAVQEMLGTAAARY